MSDTERLITVVCADLTPAQQMVQGMHAVALWVARYGPAPETFAVLSVPNETALGRLYGQAMAQGVPTYLFREPDLGDRATALTLGPEGRRLTRGLKLAMSEQPGYVSGCSRSLAG